MKVTEKQIESAAAGTVTLEPLGSVFRQETVAPVGHVTYGITVAPAGALQLLVPHTLLLE